jgi:hypothetical protein
MQINRVSPATEATTQEATLAAVFSTSAGGRTYSANVEQTGAEYTVAVTGLTGAVASGSSIAAAEENLDNRIDMLI